MHLGDKYTSTNVSLRHQNSLLSLLFLFCFFLDRQGVSNVDTPEVSVCVYV